MYHLLVVHFDLKCVRTFSSSVLLRHRSRAKGSCVVLMGLISLGVHAQAEARHGWRRDC